MKTYLEKSMANEESLVSVVGKQMAQRVILRAEEDYRRTVEIVALMRPELERVFGAR